MNNELWECPIFSQTHFQKILARNLVRFAVFFWQPLHLMHFSAGVIFGHHFFLTAASKESHPGGSVNSGVGP